MQKRMMITAVVGMLVIDTIMMTLFYLVGMINSPETLLRAAIVCALYSMVIIVLSLFAGLFSKLIHRKWQKRKEEIAYALTLESLVEADKQ